MERETQSETPATNEPPRPACPPGFTEILNVPGADVERVELHTYSCNQGHRFTLRGPVFDAPLMRTRTGRYYIPHVLQCPECGTSGFRGGSELEPEVPRYEFYRPSSRDYVLLGPRVREFVSRGGLLTRRINQPSTFTFHTVPDA